jgi:hypothetical protein
MSEFWVRILDLVRAEPVSSSAWAGSGYDQFRADLETLARERLSELARARDHIGEALDSLKNAPEWESYFGFSEIRALHPDEFLTAPEPALKLLNKLADALLQHERLRGMPHAQLSEAEDTKRLNELADIRQRIHELRQALANPTYSSEPHANDGTEPESGKQKRSDDGIRLSKILDARGEQSVAPKQGPNEPRVHERVEQGFGDNATRDGACGAALSADSAGAPGQNSESEQVELRAQEAAPTLEVDNWAPQRESTDKETSQTVPVDGEGAGFTEPSPRHREESSEEQIDRQFNGWRDSGQNVSPDEISTVSEEIPARAPIAESKSIVAVVEANTIPVSPEGGASQQLGPHIEESVQLNGRTHHGANDAVREPATQHVGVLVLDADPEDTVPPSTTHGQRRKRPLVERIERLFWRKLRHDDVAAAYWLAVCQKGLENPIVAPNLAALLAAGKLAAQCFALPQGTLEIAHSYANDLPRVLSDEDNWEAVSEGEEQERLHSRHQALRCLRAAAAMPLLFLEPEQFYYDPWFPRIPDIGDFDTHTKKWIQFRSAYGALLPETLSTLSSFLKHRQAIADWRAQLERLYVNEECADARKVRSLPRVIEHLLADKSDKGLASMVDIVENNLVAEREQGLRLADKWSSQKFLIDRIKKEGDRIFDEDFAELHDDPLARLTTIIRSGCEVVNDWAHWTNSMELSPEEGARLGRLSHALTEITTDLRVAAGQLDGLSAYLSRDLTTGSAFLQRALRQIADALAHLGEGRTPVEHPAFSIQLLLRERLEWHPTLLWTDDGLPASGQEPKLVQFLASGRQNPKSQVVLIQTCVEQSQFRRARHLAGRIQDNQQKAQIERAIEAEEQEARRKLLERVSLLEKTLVTRRLEGFVSVEEEDLCRDWLVEAPITFANDPIKANRDLDEVQSLLLAADTQAEIWAADRIEELEKKLTVVSLPIDLKANLLHHAQALLGEFSVSVRDYE